MTLRHHGLNDRALGISARQLNGKSQQQVVEALKRAAATVRKRGAQLDGRNGLPILFERRVLEIEDRLKRLGRCP